jgi:hypothetical protein
MHYNSTRRMLMEGVKIYGLCLERLKHQITNAKKRVKDNADLCRDIVLLECYNTGEIDDIIDILELYDIEDRRAELLREKLEDLAYTVSELLRERLSFDYTSNGHLGLYLAVYEESAVVQQKECLAA